MCGCCWKFGSVHKRTSEHKLHWGEILPLKDRVVERLKHPLFTLFLALCLRQMLVRKSRFEGQNDFVLKWIHCIYLLFIFYRWMFCREILVILLLREAAVWNLFLRTFGESFSRNSFTWTTGEQYHRNFIHRIICIQFHDDWGYLLYYEERERKKTVRKKERKKSQLTETPFLKGKKRPEQIISFCWRWNGAWGWTDVISLSNLNPIPTLGTSYYDVIDSASHFCKGHHMTFCLNSNSSCAPKVYRAMYVKWIVLVSLK